MAQNFQILLELFSNFKSLKSQNFISAQCYTEAVNLVKLKPNNEKCKRVKKLQYNPNFHVL